MCVGGGGGWAGRGRGDLDALVLLVGDEDEAAGAAGDAAGPDELAEALADGAQRPHEPALPRRHLHPVVPLCERDRESRAAGRVGGGTRAT